MAKPAIKSITNISAIAGAIGVLFGRFAPNLGITNDDIALAIQLISLLGGTLGVMYGRYRAGGIKGLLFDQEKKARRKSAKRVARATK